jgi:hypothetical protein
LFAYRSLLNARCFFLHQLLQQKKAIADKDGGGSPKKSLKENFTIKYFSLEINI